MVVCEILVEVDSDTVKNAEGGSRVAKEERSGRCGMQSLLDKLRVAALAVYSQTAV